MTQSENARRRRHPAGTHSVVISDTVVSNASLTGKNHRTALCSDGISLRRSRNWWSIWVSFRVGWIELPECWGWVVWRSRWLRLPGRFCDARVACSCRSTRASTWMDRFQPGAEWRLKVRLRGRGAEADKVELRLQTVELRDAHERRVEVRTPGPIPLDPVGIDETQEQWVTIPYSVGSRMNADAQVRRLRIVGTVYASRRGRFGRSESFDLDMGSSGSFRGGQVRSDPWPFWPR